MMKNILRLLILCALLLPSLAQATVDWPHEGATPTVIAECNFTTTTCSGQFSSLGPGSIVSDGSATKSPPSVLDNQLPVGQLSGGTQVYKEFSPIQAIYSGNYVKIDNNFVGVFSHVNKLYFPANLNLYIMANGDFDPFNLTVVYQQGGTAENPAPNNCHLPHDPIRNDCTGWVGGQVWFTSACAITKGTYHFIEVVVRRSTSATSQDGIIQWWMDGALCYSSTQLNYPYDITYTDVANNTWTDVDCVGKGHCSTWDIYYDHAHVSVPTIVVSTDTTPPTAPGSFAITAEGSATWTASTDNVAVTSYTVLYCTPNPCTPAQTVTTTTNLFATVAQTGDYAVWANDAAGNHSVLSNIVSFTAPTIFRTTLAVDDFQRANNTDLGASWDAGYTSATNLQIVSGIVECTAINTDCIESYNAIAAPNDQWARVIIHTFAGSVTSQDGVMLRMNNPGSTVTGYACFARFNDAGTKSYVYRFQGGSSGIVFSNNTVDFVSGDILDCQVRGTTITLSRIRNGVTTFIGSNTDAVYASGKVGIISWINTGGAVTDVQFGNFSFGGFDVTPTAQPSITGLTLDATGADVTWSSSPAPTQIRIADDRTSVVEPLSSFPAGRYTWTSILDGLTFKCMFAINSLGVENTVSTDYRCGSLSGIANPLDTAPPVMSNGLPSANLPAGTTSTTISLNINKPASCRYDTTDPVQDSTGYSLLANTMTVSSLTASATVSGLTNGSTHTYYARCQSLDALGDPHMNLTSLVITVIVDSSTADVIAPTTVTNLVGTVLSSTQVSLQWTNATDAGGIAGYWAYLCFVSDCSDALPATTQIITTNTIVLNLAPSTTYYACVKAVDTSNNFSAACSNIITFTTGPVLDVEPPSTMTNLQAAPFKNSATLTWNAGTDNSGSVFTTIELCTGTAVSCAEADYHAVVSKVAITYLVVSLSPNTTYTARGKFFDASGNGSAAYSNLAEFTTSSSGIPRPRLDVPPTGRTGADRSAAGARLPRP